MVPTLPRRQVLLRWLALTVPLPLVAVSLYALAEWLFFVTKSSVLTTVSWRERLFILAETPWPFVPILLAVQLPASLLSLIAFPRVRGLAFAPAGAVLGFLALILMDNFTHVLFGVSSVNIDMRWRIVYAALVVIFAVTCSRWLFALDGAPQQKAGRRATVLWLLAAPSLLTFVVMEARYPSKGAIPAVESDAADALRSSRPNILFLSSDGIEARRLSAYGYRIPTSPALEKLRGETLFCENAFANSCRSYAAMVSLLTGKLPIRTGVIDPPTIVQGSARYEHLPGILRSEGYRTLQLTMMYYADAGEANLAGAFDLANYDWEGLRPSRLQSGDDAARIFRLQVFDRWRVRTLRIFAAVDADPYRAVVRDRLPVFWEDRRKVRTLLRFIEETKQPWFAHVHLLDSHQPPRGLPFDYDKAIRAADDSMAQIVEHLRRSGELDRTILVISSDHGRGWQMRERIPLLIRFPNGLHARRERRNVQMIDVAPTVLEYLGLPIPSWMDGQSLLRPEQFAPGRPILGVCGYDRHLTNAPGRSNWAAPVDHLDTVTVFLGSWRYELKVRNGTMTMAAVDQHTNPGPPALKETARTVAGQVLSAHGLAIGPSP